MEHPNVDKLVQKLRDLFNIRHDRKGVQGVFNKGGAYSNVVIEISEFTFGDFEMKKLFEAKEYARAKGFFMTPRGERESNARHQITFYF